jgi:predicted nuclease of restriction endonuclease-like (RecB) superfamily
VLDLAEQGQTIEQASDIIKDPYIFEFLNIPQHHSMQKSELEE